MFCKSSLTPRNKFSEATGTEQQHNKALIPCATQVFKSLQTTSVTSVPWLVWHRSMHLVPKRPHWTPNPQLCCFCRSFSSRRQWHLLFVTARWHDSEYAQREKVPLVPSHVSEQLHILARHGWVWEPWQAKRLCVYLKVFICGHSEGWPWGLTTKCMKS